MSIGKNIAKYRKELKMTQTELGEKLGVSNQAVSKWESEISMPDVMLLPQIALALEITLEALYGMETKTQNISLCADEFPAFCHRTLHEVFYHHARMRFTHIGNADDEQLKYQREKLKDGCRIACISNTEGAVVLTDDFAFVDCDYKSEKDADWMRMTSDAEYVLKYLSDRNVRKILFFQYHMAIQNSKKQNTEFELGDFMDALSLTETEISAALKCLQELNINEVYTDRKRKTKKYVFKYSNAVYALAIYKLSALLSDESPVFLLVRDTSMISDYLFG